MKRIGNILAGTMAASVFALGTLACSGTVGGSSPATTVSSTSGSKIENPIDSSSGPAYRTVSGKVVWIKDPYYDVVEYTGNKVRIHINSKTMMISGKKKVGDPIRAEITRGGHANSIQ